MHEIGLNHVFDNGKICFCLVCKDSITEIYPLDRDGAISQHLKSECHETSARNLFKICVPDPICESRNVKYLDIVNNAEFEVWEQVGEQCYISKNDDNFFCLISKKEVSKVCVETDKLKKNLQYHLGSEVHIDKVKNSVWWIYRPNLDTNYIALNKVFMYCSFCQQVLKSKEHSLLEFAADHLETELNKTYSDKSSKIKFKAINSDNGLKAEFEERNSNNVSKTELQEKNSDNGSKTDFEENTNVHNMNLKITGDKINLYQESDELYSVGKNVESDCLDSSQVSNYSNFTFSKEQILVCPDCHELVEVFNDDVPFSTQLHSRKHKDLSIISELEVPEMANFFCPFCFKQIELFNKDAALSYNYHLENCCSENETSVVSVDNANNCFTRSQESYEKYDIIANVFSLLPDVLRDHSTFIAVVEERFKCTLCNCELFFSNDITHVSDVLQKHFSEFYHKSQYKLSMQNDNDLVEDDEDVHETDNLLKGLEVIRSNINQMQNPGTFNKNVTSYDNTNNSALVVVPGKKVRTRFQVLKILYRLVKTNPLVDVNQQTLDEKEGHFLCNLCDEILSCTCSGAELIKHLTGESHLTQLNRIKQVKGKVRKRVQVLNILVDLSRRKTVINDNIEDIGENNGRFFCNRCDEVIMCTRSGTKLVEHLNGLNHSWQVERFKEEQSQLRLQARPSQHVHEILQKLAPQQSDIKENIEFLEEKQGHFYCKICDEILMCTCSGSILIEHLKNKMHVFNFISYTAQRIEIK